MRKHVMVDIETLATSSRAHLIQIGAAVGTVEQGIVETFLVSIGERNPALYEIDDRTVDWWANQSQAARDSLELNKVPSVYEALRKFDDWLHAIGWSRDQSRACIWANPPAFDLVIMRNAYETEQRADSAPWHYRQERCARTLYNEVHKHPDIPGRSSRILSEGLVAHRADHDAIRQLETVLMYVKD